MRYVPDNPLAPQELRHESASLADQLIVAVAPELTVLGVAVILMFGNGTIWDACDIPNNIEITRKTKNKSRIFGDVRFIDFLSKYR